MCKQREIQTIQKKKTEKRKFGNENFSVYMLKTVECKIVELVWLSLSFLIFYF